MCTFTWKFKVFSCSQEHRLDFKPGSPLCICLNDNFKPKFIHRFFAKKNTHRLTKIDIHCHLNTEINHLISHTILAALCYSILIYSHPNELVWRSLYSVCLIEDYVCIILISFLHIYLTYKITILNIHVFITRLSHLTITLNNTKGTRCEAGEILILSKHMSSSPFCIGHCR